MGIMATDTLTELGGKLRRSPPEARMSVIYCFLHNGAGTTRSTSGEARTPKACEDRRGLSEG